MAKFQTIQASVEAIQLVFPMTIERPDGLVRGSLGDWLVTAGGDQFFIKDAVFRASYVEIPQIVDASQLHSVNVSVPI